MLKSEYSKLCNVAPILRWPGSKWRLRDDIVPQIRAASKDVTTYVEPFAGGASIAVAVATRFANVVLNDLDRGVYSLWSCIADPRLRRELMRKIESTTPTRELHDRCREQLDSTDLLTSGYACLIHNRTSFSGMPTASCMSDPACRFNAARLAKQIQTVGTIMEGRLTVTNLDFEDVIKDYGRRDDCILYVDCPYVEQGNGLYRVKFSEADHHRLAAALKDSTASLLISYDDHEIPRNNFAGWCEMQRLNVRYSDTSCKVKTQELLFSRPNILNIPTKEKPCQTIE